MLAFAKHKERKQQKFGMATIKKLSDDFFLIPRLRYKTNRILFRPKHPQTNSISLACTFLVENNVDFDYRQMLSFYDDDNDESISTCYHYLEHTATLQNSHQIIYCLSFYTSIALLTSIGMLTSFQFCFLLIIHFFFLRAN